MINYMSQLKQLAELKGVPLKYAFKKANVQDSTYYRVLNRDTTLREDTALKVWKWLDEYK